MANALRNLSVEFVSLVDRAAVRNPTDTSEPQRFLLWKSESGATDDPEGGTMKNDELSAALEKAETERDEALAKAEELETRIESLEKAAAEKPEVVEPVVESTEIDKSELSPAVREALEKAEARAAEADARIAKAEELAKSERDQRVRKEFIAKAETMPHVGGERTDLGELLKAASESLTTEQFDALDTILTAANEQLGASALLKSFGADGDGPRGGESEILAKAEKLQEGGMSRSEALRQAARGQTGDQYLTSVR